MPVRELWRQWEDDVADRLGADMVKASGATDWAKGKGAKSDEKVEKESKEEDTDADN